MVAPHSVNLIVTGWEQENDLVYIKLSAGKYQLGENVFTVPYAGGEQIIDKSEIENLYRIFDEQRVCAYENVDTKERMSVEQFTRSRQDLDVKQWDETTETNIWPSITARHAFELFTALWQPIRESISTRQKVEIHIEGEQPKTNHPHIQPIRKLSGDLTNTLYIYSKGAHIVSLIEHFLKKAGYRRLDQEPPSLGNPKDMDKTYWFRDGSIEFAKFFPSREAGSKYLTIEIPGLKKYEKAGVRMTGTFAEMEGYFNVIDKDIREMMGAYFNKSRAVTEIGDVKIGEVLSDLETLCRTLRQIDSMKKTASEYSSAIKLSDKLTKSFREAASKLG